MQFTPERIYRPSDPELRQIASRQTLAAWRHQRKGPPHLKIGGRVAYRGSDLLAWLDAARIVPEAAE